MAQNNDFIDVEEIVDTAADVAKTEVIDEVSKRTFKEIFVDFANDHPCTTVFAVATLTGAGLFAGYTAAGMAVEVGRGIFKGAKKLVKKIFKKDKAAEETEIVDGETVDSKEN